MSVILNVQEAKTRLSELLHRVEAGEEIIIARAGRPVASLQPVAPRKRSFDQPLLRGVPPLDANVFLEPMDVGELRDWEDGHSGDPLTEMPSV